MYVYILYIHVCQHLYVLPPHLVHCLLQALELEVHENNQAHLEERTSLIKEKEAAIVDAAKLKESNMVSVTIFSSSSTCSVTKVKWGVV